MRLVALLVVLACVGCVLPTEIEKVVEIHRDPDGKVIKMVEIERVVQRASLKLLHLEHITIEEVERKKSKKRR